MIVLTKFRIRIINSSCSWMRARARPRTHATGILYQNILKLRLRRLYEDGDGRARLGRLPSSSARAGT